MTNQTKLCTKQVSGRHYQIINYKTGITLQSAYQTGLSFELEFRRVSLTNFYHFLTLKNVFAIVIETFLKK